MKALHVFKFGIRLTEKQLSLRIGGQVVPGAGLDLMGERDIIPPLEIEPLPSSMQTAVSPTDLSLL
jgi:hypothetical protein